MARNFAVFPQANGVQMLAICIKKVFPWHFQMHKQNQYMLCDCIAHPPDVLDASCMHGSLIFQFLVHIMANSKQSCRPPGLFTIHRSAWYSLLTINHAYYQTENGHAPPISIFYLNKLRGCMYYSSWRTKRTLRPIHWSWPGIVSKTSLLAWTLTGPV